MLRTPHRTCSTRGGGSATARNTAGPGHRGRCHRRRHTLPGYYAILAAAIGARTTTGVVARCSRTQHGVRRIANCDTTGRGSAPRLVPSKRIPAQGMGDVLSCTVLRFQTQSIVRHGATLRSEHGLLHDNGSVIMVETTPSTRYSHNMIDMISRRGRVRLELKNFAANTRYHPHRSSNCVCQDPTIPYPALLASLLKMVRVTAPTESSPEWFV